MAKPRLCKRCKAGEDGCVVSTCVKAANAYEAGRAAAFREVLKIAERFEVSTAELVALRHNALIEGDEVSCLIDVLWAAEASVNEVIHG